MKKWDILHDVKDTISTDDVIAILLKNRNLTTKEQIDNFIYPKLEDVTAGSVGIDRKELLKTIKRLEAAIDEKEKIIVYGDYDVDGITGAAILWETLHDMLGNVMPYIPHRIDEGYGLSIKGIENVLEKYPDTKLIITVDNGIVANEAVEYANKKGLEVIITDHHVSDDGDKKLPDAYAIVHTTKLCGAGVAYVLTLELKSKNKAFKNPNNHLELVALATIADLVPLTEANRTLVRFGLQKLCNTKREGLRALFGEAGIDPTNIGVYEVGHIIGPRLNASGRLTSAMDSLRLLCTRDPARALELAASLGGTNKERQLVMTQAADHAKLSVKARKELKKLLVIADESYPEGVIGLVAGRLVEEYYRPSIVIAKKDKLSKGSVRSVAGFNIIEFLRSLSDYFVNVGGHPMAAGFTIETDKIEDLQKKIEELTDTLIDDKTLTRSLRIDCEIPMKFITNSFYKSIMSLSPFGMGNPQPTFVSREVEVKGKRVMGKLGNHVKLLLADDASEFDGVAFGMVEEASEISPGDKIDIVYTVDENVWNGQRKLQLKIKDLHSSK
jgi:single-stranded-DNA-specific exonuclease